MNVSLTPELEGFIKGKVACGLYTSASEVIRESLRLMHAYDDVQKQRMAEVHHAIDAGMTQLNNQKFVDGKTSKKKMKQKLNTIAKE